MNKNKHTHDAIKPTTFVELVFPLLFENISTGENLCGLKIGTPQITPSSFVFYVFICF